MKEIRRFEELIRNEITNHESCLVLHCIMNSIHQQRNT